MLILFFPSPIKIFYGTPDIYILLFVSVSEIYEIFFSKFDSSLPELDNDIQNRPKYLWTISSPLPLRLMSPRPKSLSTRAIAITKLSFETFFTFILFILFSYLTYIYSDHINNFKTSFLIRLQIYWSGLRSGLTIQLHDWRCKRRFGFITQKTNMKKDWVMNIY